MISSGFISAPLGRSFIARSVSSIAFAIKEKRGFLRAVKLSAEWMRGINTAIPENAIHGLEFEVGGGGTHPARAVAFSFNGGRIWSSTIDNPDDRVLGRTWITEITVAQRDEEVHFGARLLNITRGTDEIFTPSVPRLAREIIEQNYCVADGVRLKSAPSYINTDTDTEWLVSLLENKNRQLPVIVMGEAVNRPPLVKLENLSRRLCGAAHVVGVSTDQNRNFRNFTGRDLAVFDGSVRLFRPDPSLNDADPYSHPLWIPKPEQKSPWSGAGIISRTLSLSISRGTTDYPRFDTVRQAAAERSLAVLRKKSSDADMVKLYEEENQTLVVRLKQLRLEQNQWLADAEEERTSFDRNIAELNAEIYRYKLQTKLLRQALLDAGKSIDHEPLRNLMDFGDWVSSNLSPNIWISPKAIKEAERNAVYRDPEEIGNALLLLDELYVPMRRNSETRTHQLLGERLQEKGLTIADCFSQQNDIKRFPEYSVMYQGQRIWCNLHVKRGGGTDPRAMFRIYFTWLPDNDILVIGHLPTHLDNNLTN